MRRRRRRRRSSAGQFNLWKRFLREVLGVFSSSVSTSTNTMLSGLYRNSCTMRIDACRFIQGDHAGGFRGFPSQLPDRNSFVSRAMGETLSNDLSHQFSNRILGLLLNRARPFLRCFCMLPLAVAFNSMQCIVVQRWKMLTRIDSGSSHPQFRLQQKRLIQHSSLDLPEKTGKSTLSLALHSLKDEAP